MAGNWVDSPTVTGGYAKKKRAPSGRAFRVQGVFLGFRFPCLKNFNGLAQLLILLGRLRFLGLVGRSAVLVFVRQRGIVVGVCDQHVGRNRRVLNSLAAGGVILCYRQDEGR